MFMWKRLKIQALLLAVLFVLIGCLESQFVIPVYIPFTDPNVILVEYDPDLGLAIIHDPNWPLPLGWPFIWPCPEIRRDEARWYEGYQVFKGNL